MTPAPGEVTKLLNDVRNGHRQSEEPLFNLVYRQLHSMAAGQLRRERKGHTLQPTALVHEAYFELVAQVERDWNNRAHFLSVAAQVMRRILIDYARQHNAEKRGGGKPAIELDGQEVVASCSYDDLITVNDALDKLAVFDARQARVVEMRFFGGLTEEETAAALGVSSRTVKRDWNVARAWLQAEIGG